MALLCRPQQRQPTDQPAEAAAAQAGARAADGGAPLGASAAQAEAALRPFLFNHATHFWHELT
jgi:hypothetical protein